MSNKCAAEKVVMGLEFAPEFYTICQTLEQINSLEGFIFPVDE